jgi:hypothetical protein
MLDKKSTLATELQELFDIRNAKNREEKKLNDAAIEAQKDIRLITHMFRDGIPDVTVSLGKGEFLKWDAKTQKLLSFDGDGEHILEAASKQTMIRLRPYLSQLVKQAKDFYKD